MKDEQGNRSDFAPARALLSSQFAALLARPGHLRYVRRAAVLMLVDISLWLALPIVSGEGREISN